MDFLNGSFRIGRLFDITIRVHVLYIIWMMFRFFQAGNDWHFEAMFMGMLFGIILVHEFGHCMGARSVGGDAENILMWPLGGLAFAHAPMTPWAQFVTVACGPLVNVVFCLVSGLVLVGATGTIGVLGLSPFASVNYSLLSMYPHEWLWYVAIFYSVNYFLLALNLLPIYPLDGGQLFQCIIWPFVGLQRATLYACQLGIAGCILFGVWGLTGGAPMLIFIAMFGGFTCWQRLQALKYGMVVDERVAMYNYRPNRTGQSIWQRLFRFKRRPPRRPTPTRNPNPGGWEQRQNEQSRIEGQLDEILKKVHEHGIQSLSYVERQTLERATRARQERERDFERHNRV